MGHPHGSSSSFTKLQVPSCRYKDVSNHQWEGCHDPGQSRGWGICRLLICSLHSGKDSNQGVSIEWMVVREESTGSWGLRVTTLRRLNHMKLLILNAYALVQYKNSLIPCPIPPGLLSLEMGGGRSSGTNRVAFWWTTGFFWVPAVTTLGLINFYWRQNHVECAGSYENLWYVSSKRYHERWPNGS